MKMTAFVPRTPGGRRVLLLAVYGIFAAVSGASLATAPGAAPQPSATRVVSPADKAAANAQFDKAKALYDDNRLAEAQVENDKALKLDPANMNAVLLQGLIKSKLTSGPTVTGAGGAVSTATAAGGGGGGGGKIGVLTSQQVSVIRLMELGAADHPTGRVDAKALEDFWQNVMLKDPATDRSAAAQRAFVSPANFPNQIRRIRDGHDIKYMEQVTITTDPALFVAYRTNVQNYVLQSCATGECHGGEKSPGGNFHLLPAVSGAEQQYTNYYILSQYANKDGQMIDRDSPEKSLVLQYALPWQIATAKHPKVDVKRLTGGSDPRGRAIADWIRSLPIPKPVYGISYAVPGAAPASAPAAISAAPAAPK